MSTVLENVILDPEARVGLGRVDLRLLHEERVEEQDASGDDRDWNQQLEPASLVFVSVAKHESCTQGQECRRSVLKGADGQHPGDAAH